MSLYRIQGGRDEEGGRWGGGRRGRGWRWGGGDEEETYSHEFSHKNHAALSINRL